MSTPTRPRDCSWVPGCFNNINATEFVCSSDPTLDYNCIAHAAGKDDVPWWPTEIAGYYWPEELPKEPTGRETVDNFIKAFQLLGYEQCRDGNIESGFEKVAIYTDQNKVPKHAARSLPRGVWTSKLGDEEDIEHNNLDEVNCALYGSAQSFLKRKFNE